ncbi:MAG: APC family permease, partial [Actinobacteria bacterium]|nr:APC family permease [Actinomycetota bacterium]
MATSDELDRVGPAPVARSEDVHRLKAGAVGLFGVLFMALANAAPITAMSGNVPIAVGSGNGLGAPGGFLFATVVLCLFAVGYVAMARHLTTTGAFFGFISHGLGQIWGMASGFTATLAYVVFEGSLIGIFSYFGNATIQAWFHVDVSWLLIAAVGIAVIALLGYYDINITALILGCFLVCEVLLLALLSFSVLFRGGGANGLIPQAVNPVNSFKGLAAGGSDAGGSRSLGLDGADGKTLIPAGSAAIGLFFAFWSWVGFETTAVYGEESRNPRRIVPRATLIAVVGLGLFYTFVSWMVLSGNGIDQSISLAATNPLRMFESVFDHYLGRWAVHAFEFLIVTGSFACALAFHNAAARYLYAIGREFPSQSGRMGATHPKHGSPHIASLVQSGVTLVVTILFFAVEGSDPTAAAYTYQYGILAVLGTMAILVVQVLTS